MLIKSLYLRNVKSYADETIHFELGTNAIIGANGSGKSTLLEAIGFVLFDAMPPGFTLAGLLRESAPSGAVVLTIVSSLDGRDYEIERSFTSSTSRIRVYDPELDRAVLADGQKDVQSWIRQHLRMEPTARLDELFVNTIGVPQGTFTAPFLLPAGPRKEIFDPLLQVADYAKASVGLNVAARHLADEAATLRTEIARAEGQLSALPAIQRELEALAETLRSIEGDLAVASAGLSHDAADLQALDGIERLVRESEQRASEARLRRDAVPPRLAAACQALAEAERAADAVAASAGGHAAYEAADARISGLSRRQHERDALLAQRTKIDRDAAQADAQQTLLECGLQDVAVAEERLQQIRPLVAQQEALERALHDAEADCVRRQAAEQTLASAQDQERRAYQQLAQAEQALDRARKIEKQVHDLQAEIDEQRQRLGAASAAAATAHAELQRLERQSAALRETAAARCPVCETDLTPERRDEILSRNASAIASLRTELSASENASSQVEARIRQAEDESRRLLKERANLGDTAAVERAQSQAEDWRRQREGAERLALTLVDAPARRDAQRASLAALGDPRQQSAVLAAQVNKRPALQRELLEIREAVSRLAARRTEIDALLSVFSGLEEDIAATHRERNQHRADYIRYQQNQQTADQLPARQTQVEQLVRLLEAAESALAAAEREAGAARAGYDPGRHDELRQRVIAGRDRVARLRAQREAAISQHAERQREADRLALVAEGLGRLQAELADRQAMERLLKVVQGLLREAGPHVTRQLVSRISHNASAFYGDIMGDHSNHLSWSEDYNLTLDVRGRSRSFRQLSGGEQMCAAIALRLALLREMAHMDVAFFDEPTTNLDAERREGLADRIMQVKGFLQLFVISHDDTFERAAQNYIRIVKDASGSHVEAL